VAALLKALAGLIPWADVVRSAPAILAAAKELIEGAPKSSEPPRTVRTEDLPPEETLRLLREENAFLRASVVELQADSRRQAEVIERLAEQADGLAAGLELFRKRLKLAIGVAVVGLVLAAASLVMFFIR